MCSCIEYNDILYKLSQNKATIRKQKYLFALENVSFFFSFANNNLVTPTL